jgi:hypothetical protein
VQIINSVQKSGRFMELKREKQRDINDIMVFLPLAVTVNA